jgi:fatty-acyl-CoA synthase
VHPLGSEGSVSSTVKLDLTQDPRWEWLNLPHLLERVGNEPDRPAIVIAGEHRTYGQLKDGARRVANSLVELGVEPMDRVAIASTNRLEFMEIEVGIAAAQGIMVGLNWRLSPREAAFLLQRSEARVLFVEDRFLDSFVELRHAGALPGLETIVVLGDGDADHRYDELCASASAERPTREGRFSDPHEIIYTSGTTGNPKGVVWTNGMVLFNALQYATDLNLTKHKSHYTLVDMYYIGGRHAFVWPLLLQGGTAHIKPSGGFDAGEVVRYWADHRITHQMVAPTMLYDILAVPDLASYDLSALEILASAGGPLSKSAIERAQELLPATQVMQIFGMTEGGACITFVPGEYAREKAGSAGRATWHSEIRIRDDAGRDLPPGEIGEIVLRSATVTAGYWDADDMTHEAIVDGWLHTGDLGYLDEDDFLFISGRKKDLIISGGMNIYPVEIEDVLREHPTVSDAAVIGVPHERWGETVCAVVEAADGAEVDEDELIAFCKERLASFKKPTMVRVVDAIPRTAAGKPQKFRLREQFGEPVERA